MPLSRRRPNRPIILAVTIAGLALSNGVQAKADDTSPPAKGGEQGANQPGAEIVVTAHALRELGQLAGRLEIEGDELLRQNSPQIGEVLAKLPGVSATSFAPGVSRPILRGFSGDRVLVLIDGIGSLDASSVSADHGVALDTLTIDHIDILHGPALLAYGGQAIGGAVIAHDKRIPRRMPENAVDIIAQAGFASVSDDKSASASIDVPLTATVAFHVDASWHDANDEQTGGNVVSAPLRAELLAEAGSLRAAGDTDAADGLELQAIARRRIANSFSNGTSIGAGGAWLGDTANLGVSLQRIDNRYGIPGRPGAGNQGVSIDMHQTRLDLRGAIEPAGGFVDRIELRAAYADYGHAEIEADGVAGTLFSRRGVESRLEFVQAKRGGWRGRSGLQYSRGRLSVAGEEAILPRHSTERIGAFTLQSVKVGAVELQGAARLERVSILAPTSAFDRSFTLRSAAAGATWQPSSVFTVGASFTHGERAPSPEELLTEGGHVATQAFEIGDRSFERERSNGVEAYLEYKAAGTSLNLTAYLTDFSHFISLEPTGGIEDGFPVFRYLQRPARFEGFEAQASQKLAELGSGSLALDMTADYVRASLKGSGPVPRIPPLRIQGGLEYQASALTLRGEVEWNAAQKRVPQLEFPTQSFALVNLSATWRPLGKDGALTLVFAGDNLFDTTGRRAASFTRDFVPIAGRDIRLTARLAL